MNKIEQFQEVTKEMKELYECKNNAYGDSFSRTYGQLGLISAVTRISDKFNRLVALATNKNIDDFGETLRDTLIDLASYSVMTIIELDGKE